MSDAAGPPTDAPATTQSTPQVAPVRWSIVLLGGVVVLAVVSTAVYLWPSVGRSSARVDVVVAGDGFVQQGQEALERRLRERGLSVTSLVAASSSLCDDREELERVVRDARPAVVVLSFRRAEAGCDAAASGADPTLATYDDVLASLGGSRVVLAMQPAGQDQAVQDAYLALRERRVASVADPSTLLGGAAAPAVMRCQWWDDCRPDGTVEVRQGDGGPLTDAGDQRFARVVVGVIP
jgi:hypothetical protein